MIPTWLHPIVRKIFMSMVNDEWTRAGRPILAENVTEVECVIKDGGWWLKPLDETFKQPKDGTKVFALFIEDDGPVCNTCRGTKRIKCDRYEVPLEEEDEYECLIDDCPPGWDANCTITCPDCDEDLVKEDSPEE